MIYKYKAVTQKGKVIKGTFKSLDELGVISMLKDNNYLPIKIEENKILKSNSFKLLKQVNKKDLAIFCRQFYTMLDAGIDIVNCIEIIEVQVENKKFSRILKLLYEDIQKGSTLSEAMKIHQNIFPYFLINMVEGGEISGSLDIIMERMATHYEKDYQLENKIKSSLSYPILLSFISIGVVIFLLLVVMPSFIRIFDGNGQILPRPTRILLKMSNYLRSYWYLITGSVIVLSLLFRIFEDKLKVRIFIDKVKIKIPIIKNINIKIITGRFTRTLSTLISSGIPLIQSIELVGKVIDNKFIEEKLEVVMEEIRRGTSISKSIENIKVFPPMVSSMIKIGEESGSIDNILYKTADYYDNELESALDEMTRLIEPLILIIMAIFIGFIVISMALPMFDVINIME